MANSAPVFVSEEPAHLERITYGSPNSDSQNASYSPDGTKIVFQSSDRSYFDSSDRSANSDIFIKDLETGKITRISKDSNNFNDGGSYDPVFSPDGKQVGFRSDKAFIVTGDKNAVSDLFVRDLEAGSITRVSTTSSGGEANGASYDLVFSPDGSRIAFRSDATNLVTNDTNGHSDIFVKDLTSGEVTRVSVSASGAQANRDVYEPVFSPDGSKIMFSTTATNLISGTATPYQRVYIKDIETGNITLISNSTSEIANHATFSADGTKVAYSATRISDGSQYITVKDLSSGSITKIYPQSGASIGKNIDNIEFSYDGQKIAFNADYDNGFAKYTSIQIFDLNDSSFQEIGVSSLYPHYNNPHFSPDGNNIIFSSDDFALLKSGETGFDIFSSSVGVSSSKFSQSISDDEGEASLSASGSLFFSDADATDIHTVSVVPQAGTLGSLVASVVVSASGAEHIEWSYNVDSNLIAGLGQDQSHIDTFTLTLDDGQGGTATQDVTVTLNGINDAPVITSASTVTFAENGTSPVLKIAASDPDGDALSYSISGTDAHLFTLAADGTLAFRVKPDYEAPDDGNKDHVYDLILSASDGSLSTQTTLAVTVTDIADQVNRAPVITSPGSVTFAENGTGPVLKIAASDPDGDALSYSISGTDAHLFTLAADGTLAFRVKPDYEAPDDGNKDHVYDLILSASDGALTATKALAVTVTDVAEGGGTPPLTGDDGANTLTGTSGDDTVHAGGGDDVAQAGAGSDTVYGDAGNDQLSGQGGDDLLDGGTGNDIAWGGDGNDTVSGGADGDMLYGENGDDVLDGGAGADQLFGGAGHNVLAGGEGDDFLYAGWNGDRLVGGAGHDLVFGGAGADTFVLSGPQAADSDMFFNFTSGNDKVEIRGSDYGLSAGALDAAHFQVGNAATGSAGTFVYNPTVGTLSWDADGAGSGAAVTVATLIGGSLALGDLLVI